MRAEAGLGISVASEWPLQLREAIDQMCEPRWHIIGTTGVRECDQVEPRKSLICMNVGGRGRYRTADRWCVKPELYH
jgi:hypothetical protein